MEILCLFFIGVFFVTLAQYFFFEPQRKTVLDWIAVVCFGVNGTLFIITACYNFATL